MKDQAFIDRAEELGLLPVLQAVAEALSGNAAGARLCSCDVAHHRYTPSSIPHDLTCGLTRMVVMFGTPQVLEYLRDRDHVSALRIAARAADRTGDWWDVEMCRAIIENRPTNEYRENVTSKAP